MAGLEIDIPDPAEVEETYFISIDLTPYLPKIHVRIPESAENVDVRIIIDRSSFSPTVFPAALASEFSSSRGTNCWVRLLYTQIDLEEQEWSPERLTDFLETLDGFENVYLFLYLDVGRKYHPLDRRLLNVRNSDILTEILLARGSVMQGTLGPMSFHDSGDPRDRYLEFHPCRFREANEMGGLDCATFEETDGNGGENGLNVSVKSSASDKKRKAESAEDVYGEGIGDTEAKRLKRGKKKAM